MAHAVSRKGNFRTTAKGGFRAAARPSGARRARARGKAREMSFFYAALVWFIAVTVVGSVIVWSRLTVVGTGYEISRANADRNELIERNKRLTLEMMELKNPERIERIASGKLGLVYPTGNQVVIIR